MEKNKCLQCEKNPISRGLCRTHYAQFDKIKKAAEASGADGGAIETIGFYWLRHTFLSIAEETKDFEAARAIMGHIDATITGQYRSRVSDERLEAVSEYVRRWLK
jgi:integrase